MFAHSLTHCLTLHNLVHSLTHFLTLHNLVHSFTVTHFITPLPDGVCRACKDWLYGKQSSVLWCLCCDMSVTELPLPLAVMSHVVFPSWPDDWLKWSFLMHSSNSIGCKIRFTAYWCGECFTLHLHFVNILLVIVWRI